MKTVNIETIEGNHMVVKVETRDALKGLSGFHIKSHMGQDHYCFSVKSEVVLKFDPTAKITWENPEAKKLTKKQVEWGNNNYREQGSRIAKENSLAKIGEKIKEDLEDEIIKKYLNTQNLTPKVVEFMTKWIKGWERAELNFSTVEKKIEFMEVVKNIDDLIETVRYEQYVHPDSELASEYEGKFPFDEMVKEVKKQLASI